MAEMELIGLFHAVSSFCLGSIFFDIISEADPIQLTTDPVMEETSDKKDKIVFRLYLIGQKKVTSKD